MAKRRRVAAYHDIIPVNDYDTVFERQEVRRRVGTSVLSTTTSTRTATDSWNSTTAWAPPDDPHYALDPDGNLYDEALEAEVMEETLVTSKKGKGKSKVSVSVISRPVVNPNSLTIATFRGVRTLRGWRAIVKHISKR